MNARGVVLAAAELALVALSVVVTIALERLFDDTEFLRDLLIMVVGSHVVAIVVRRAGLGMVSSTLVSAAVLVLLGTAVFYPESAALIAPTRDTATQLGDDLREAWTVFSDESAPVPPLRGFLVTASVFLWYGSFLADWAAFRLRSPLEAIAPATSMFVFVALLGVDRNQVAHGVAYAGGVLAVLLGLRAERQVREEVWVAGGTERGIRTTLRLGATAGLLAVVAGGLIAPGLPGADGQPLIDVTEINEGPQTRHVVSPLVGIASTLINQSDDELFTVRVAQEDGDYWRLMALTSFDGNLWTRSSNFDDARGAVGTDVDPSVPRRTVRQEITTVTLGNIYLPVAYEVAQVVDDGGVALEYETATGALVIKEEAEAAAQGGFTYVIDSQVPDYSPDALPADASAGLASGFVAEHTLLPPTCGSGETAGDGRCWPERVTELARQVTAGATSDFERARLLQAFFTDPDEFAYQVSFGRGEGVDDIEEFLFQIRRGYCQQFSSTFAAMARSLGIPARVAVGFTPGEWDEQRQVYVVRGHHAHAWPEVFFAGVGWVAFEPTPGRGRPFDTDITGRPPAQYPANELDGPAPTSTVPDDPGPRNTVPPVGGFEAGPLDTTAPGADPVTTGGPDGATPGALWVLLGVGGAAVAAVAAIPTIKSLRRRRRLHRVAADPVGRGELAWDDALRALRLVGYRPAVGHTPLEFARSVERSRRHLGPVAELAERVTVLRYAAPGNGVEHAVAAQDAAGRVVARCHELAGRRAVVGAAIDPRELVDTDTG